MRYIQNEVFKAIDSPKIDIEDIVRDYKIWVADEKFILLQKKRDGKKSLFKKMHAAKRGDGYYCQRTENRFICRTAHVPDFEYFSARDRGLQKTDLIFVTLTYAVQDMKNWIDNGKHYQEFANRLRSMYGKIEFIRVWESHESGYPHCHAVIRLKKEIYCRKINKIWRVVSEDFNIIKGYWTHGFSDVKALNGTTDVVSYLMKYILKQASDDKHTKTLAMMWLFEKRAFSISKRFFEDCRTKPPCDLIIRMHNSYQKERWEYVGCFKADEIQKLIIGTWEIELFLLRDRGKNRGLEDFLNL